MSKVYFMCKKSFKVWYLGHSTQDLHRNRIYKIFFQNEKSCFPCPECQKNVRNTFFRLFGKFHKKKSWPCHDRIADPSPPLRGGGVRFPMTVLGAVPFSPSCRKYTVPITSNVQSGTLRVTGFF